MTLRGSSYSGVFASVKQFAFGSSFFYNYYTIAFFQIKLLYLSDTPVWGSCY